MEGFLIMDTQIITLSDHCRFHMGDEPEAWQAWYDDTDWQEVTLPREWILRYEVSLFW